MKKGVMLLLMLAGLTGMGAIQAMVDVAAEQAKSAGAVEHNKRQLLTSGTFYADSYVNSGAIFPGISSRQPSMTDIRKTLKGYRSINRITYPIQLLELV